MRLISPRNILNRYNIRPSKRLGQNFLIDKIVLNKIVRAADIKLTDVVLEIGPGMGVLTQELVKKAKMVVAIEKDSKMVEILKEVLKDYKNLEIINKDILKIENWELIAGRRADSAERCNCKLKIENYKLVANLPYYITSPIIRKFLEIKNPPKLMILMVQKEVAQRICASPPTKNLVGGKPSKMNLLAVSVQFYAKPEIIDYVSKQCFWPKPKVDSAIIKIIPWINADVKQIDTDLFFKIVKAGFSQPRKYIANNFIKGLALSSLKGVKLNNEQINNWLSKNKINPNQRAESLTVKNWINLTKTFRNFTK